MILWLSNDLMVSGKFRLFKEDNIITVCLECRDK